MTSKSECCAECRFADPISDDEREIQFDCRRYPPAVSSALLERNIETASLDMAMLTSTVFPVVDGEDWCGEFKAKAKARP